MLSGDDLTIVLFFVGTAVSIACGAMSAAGWRHPALIWGLFGLASVCFIIGAAWPALKTVSPAFTAIVDQVATNPVAWFAVLILGMTASLLLPKRGGRAFIPLNEREPTPDESRAAVPAAAAASVPPPPRVFINVTPRYMAELFKDRTSIQGDALAAPYMGKWIVVTGKVRDIFFSGEALLVQMYDNEEQSVSARFSKEGSEKISQLATGATITVRGEIYEIDGMRVRLRQCELDQAS